MAVIILTLIFLSLLFTATSSAPPNFHSSSLTALLDAVPVLVEAPIPERNPSRSLWEIVVNCLLTLFACTWIAVHPNIPAPGDRWWTVAWRRVGIMAFVLLTPEMIIFWAWRQALAAKDIAAAYHERGWTKTHGFFVQMGGFMLFRNGEPLHTLTLSKLEDLVQRGDIDFPDVTDAEIQDRSKGDPFAKGVVLLHTTWFITKCITRAAQGLVITELEIVTLALAVQNSVMYMLWWKKPLDVRVSVRVNLKPDSTYTLDDYQRHESSVVISSSSRQHTGPSQMPGTAVDETMFRKLWRWTKETILGFIVSSLHTLLAIFGFSTSVYNAVIDQSGSSIFDALTGMYMPYFLSPTVGPSHQRTHTFYAEDRPSALLQFPTMLVVLTGLAFIFGGVHCFGWGFPFASILELYAWRISAVLLTCAPAVYSVTVTWLIARSRGGVFLACVAIFYITARVMLLLVAVVSMRALPVGAYTEIQWVSLISH
ncbi:hypothetical protein BDQ12DRAFT_719178 [Crucibulum laeve]|uniref:Uncharacterized protein n=1 Tax=Crucibulum laeve TaxID=68775 RepID=A0A5C3MD18_9AGAR|nr:hypothetical protein BDQ12DRAFT_719178 [Crucibulum laeve]